MAEIKCCLVSVDVAGGRVGLVERTTATPDRGRWRARVDGGRVDEGGERRSTMKRRREFCLRGELILRVVSAGLNKLDGFCWAE